MSESIINQLDTIYQLLESTDTQFRVFDMGRRVQKISQADFKAFEDTTIAYPYPLQQKAWMAILFWDKKRSKQQFLWFLNFALDEQGKLIQATRNHFIAMVIEVLGTQLTENAEQQDKLDNNPYTFKPEQNKLAMLNAQIKCQTKQSASVYYKHAQSYLQGKLGWSQWQSVGVQGLGDFVCRLEQDNNLQSLLTALPHLPPEVQTPLLSLLEHVAIGAKLTEVLYQQGLQALKNHDKSTLINTIRAISFSQAAKIRQQLLQQVMTSEWACDQDILLVITGRCWLDLLDEQLQMAFLENLAKASPEQQLFQGVIADLVAIPAVRQGFLQSFRNPQRSAQLTTAIGHLFGQ